MFSQLDALKTKLDALRPLPPALVQNLHEDLVLRWTYHSNAIEGNTLKILLLEPSFGLYTHALGQVW